MKRAAQLRTLTCLTGGCLAAILLGTSAAHTADKARQPSDFAPVSRLLDISGLAWLGHNRLLAVHDAKYPDEDELVRVSLLTLPISLHGILWKPLDVRFPEGKSSDLESAARIPGSDQVLLVESADDGSSYRRIFLAEIADDALTIVDVLAWDTFTDPFNIEATAVARTDQGYVFIWAERSSGMTSTDVAWAGLTLEPFAIGTTGVRSVPFSLPAEFVTADGAPLYSRPLVGLDVGDDGVLYGVTAFDGEGIVSNPDNGPFRSAVLRIGSVVDGGIELDASPTLIATIDGFKTESIVARNVRGRTHLIIGTDDENYGGTLRPLPAPDLP